MEYIPATLLTYKLLFLTNAFIQLYSVWWKAFSFAMNTKYHQSKMIVKLRVWLPVVHLWFVSIHVFVGLGSGKEPKPRA